MWIRIKPTKVNADPNPQHWLFQGGLKDYLLKNRYGTVRYGTVRYGTVRYGTVRYGTRAVAYEAK